MFFYVCVLRTDINVKKIINDVVVQRSIVQSLGNAVFTSSLLEESTFNKSTFTGTIHVSGFRTSMYEFSLKQL